MSRNATTTGVERMIYAEPMGDVRIGGSEEGREPPAMRQKGHGIFSGSIVWFNLGVTSERVLKSDQNYAKGAR
jgi:hypothetical protein